MEKYYLEKYDRRMGGDFIEIYDEQLEYVKSMRVKKTRDGIVYRETGIPIDPELIRVIQTDSTVAALYRDMEVLGKGLAIPKEMWDFTTEEHEKIAKAVAKK